ncbi:MAG: T9SS type B sorting domain-containing protein [Bacteroidetes bacterium]|nr:T9SS type B sorting domain-containing protein [Bacteroidota bacterium]
MSIDPITAEFQVVSFNGTKKAFFPETEGAFHYAWDFGDGATSNEERPVHTYLAPGDYVITLTIIDACGDSTSATQEIEIDGCQPGWRGQIRSLNNYVEPDEDICDFVQDGVMHLPSSFSDINYYWTNFNFCDTICIPENFTFQARLKNAQQDGGLNAYDITVSLTGEGLNTGLKAMGASWALQYTRIWSGDTQLNDLPELIFDFSEFFILEMEFSNGVVYFKYNGTVFKELPAQEAICDIRNIRFYFKGSGMVDWLKVADEGGEVIFEENFDDCQNMEEPEICTPAPFLVNFDQQLGCELGELVINPLSGDGPFVYNLVPNPNDISTSDSIFTDLPPDNYTATAAAVCSYQDSSIQFSIPEPLRDSIVFQEAAICGGLGQIVISGIDGVPPYGYKLNDGDWQDAGTFTELTPGTYQITVKDQRGCESTRAVEITSQVSEIQLDVDSTDLSWSCLDQDAFISFSAQGDALYHFFQLDDRPPQADGLFTDLTPGLYTVIAIDENNCYSQPYEFEVTEEYINFPNVQAFTICEGDSVVVGNQVYSQAGTYLDTLTSVQGCDSTVTTELTVNASYNSNLQSTICQSDTLLFNGQPLTETGTYTAEYQTTLGCDSTVTLELAVLPEYEETLQATICEGETYLFNEQGLDTAGTYEAILQSQAGCDSLVVLQLAVETPSESFFDTTLCEGEVLDIGGEVFETAGDYTLQLTDANGCDSTVYLMLDYYPPPLYEVETTPDFGYGDGSLLLMLSDSTHTLIWEDGSVDLERTNLQAGFYYASIEDEWGCVAEIEVEVPGGELQLAMPNTFTPNGDGTNDFFNVVGNAEAQVAVLRIFNRWGQQVYNNEYPTRGWDGTFNGKPQPAEVYYYQIEVQTPDGVWTRQGDVTLVR